MDIFADTIYWGILLSVGSYIICSSLQRKYQSILLNPLLFSTIITIIFLKIVRIDYQAYYETSNFLNYLLSPATVCLAVPLYEQICILKKYSKAILLGIVSGVFAGMGSVLAFSMLFRFSHIMYVTLLPKSITTAIAISVSEEIGGIPSLTVPIVILTGITGHIIAEKVCTIFRITEPIAVGVAIGAASHAMGTTKAIEIGEVEGAMSSLSIAVAGFITVFCAFLFSKMY